MAKKDIQDSPEAEVEETEDAPVEAEPVSEDRQARWQAFLAKAEKENPLFSMQKEAGEFDKIPDSFK